MQGEFEVIQGRHVDEDGNVYEAGEVVKTNLPLHEMFHGKFKVIKEPSGKEVPEGVAVDKKLPGARLIDDTNLVGTAVKDNKWTRRARHTSTLNTGQPAALAKAEDLDEDDPDPDEVEYGAESEDSEGTTTESAATLRRKALQGRPVATEEIARKPARSAATRPARVQAPRRRSRATEQNED
jgi:hypothetical protein